MDPLRRGGDRRGAGSAVLFQHQRLPAGGSGQHHYQSFRAVCTSVSGWFTDKQNYYEDVTALKAENEALKKQIAEMEATVRQGEAASQENVFLRDLLDLRQQRRDLSDFETATVTERGVTNWTASLTLNKGAVHGVEVGDCVIDGNGNLVGRISKAGYDWSTVLTVIDTDTSLGAVSTGPRTSALPAAISPDG